jgi:hypothetical protein
MNNWAENEEGHTAFAMRPSMFRFELRVYIFSGESTLGK